MTAHPQTRLALLFAAFLALATLAAAGAAGARLAAATPVSELAGFALYRTAFGFTAG
jgi:hypothetical protein